MASCHIIAILITLTALFSFLNHRYIHLHATVGVMLIALLLSVGLITLGHFGFGIKASAERFFERVPLGTALLQGMLGFRPFAGALRLNLAGCRFFF